MISEPFPHFVVQNAHHNYNELLANYPKIEGDKENTRYNLVLREKPQLHPVWQDFVRTYTSQEVFDEICKFFNLPHKGMKVGIKGLDNNCEVTTGINFSKATPTTKRGYYGGDNHIHLDTPEQIYSILMYFGEADGGDLNVYQVKRPRLYYLDQQYPKCYKPKDVTFFKRIKYEHNTVVGFVNSIFSAHGTTPREPSDQDRLWVTVDGNALPNKHKYHMYDPHKYLATSERIKRKVKNIFVKNIPMVGFSGNKSSQTPPRQKYSSGNPRSSRPYEVWQPRRELRERTD